MRIRDAPAFCFSSSVRRTARLCSPLRVAAVEEKARHLFRASGGEGDGEGNALGNPLRRRKDEETVQSRRIGGRLQIIFLSDH